MTKENKKMKLTINLVGDSWLIKRYAMTNEKIIIFNLLNAGFYSFSFLKYFPIILSKKNKIQRYH